MLLIPLPETNKSRARFPQKIANFCLTGNPIITTNVREIQYYFKDKESILVANSYNIKGCSEKINFVFENLKYSKLIGNHGRESAIKNYNPLKHASLLLEYIDNLA